MGECNPCTILQNSAAQALRPLIRTIVNDLLPFPFSTFLADPISAVAVTILQPIVGNVLKILPASLIENCKTLDIDEIITEHIENGRIVERLRI